MNPFSVSTWRGLAAAGASAVLVASIGLVSSSAAEPAAPTATAAHDGSSRPWAQHLQSHLDRLAERLEIKASQQDAWQKFSAAFKETAGDHAAMEHGPVGKDAAAEVDAATLARRHADFAQQHAQHLAQLADATSALQAALGPEQRQLFNEVARHYAAEHEHMGAMAHGYGGDAHHEGHCSGHESGHEGYHGGPGHAMSEADGDGAAANDAH